MAISFVSANQTSSSSATSLNPSEPGDWLENDFVLMFGAINSTGGAFTDPADITELDQEDTAPTFAWMTYVGWKFRGSTAGSGYQLSSSSGAAQMALSIVAFRGVDLTTPFDVTFVKGSHYVEHNNSVTGAGQPITTVTNGAEVVLLQHWNGGVGGFTLLPPTNYTSRSEVLAASRTNFIVSRNIASAGTETPGVFTTSGSVTTQDSSVYTLALRPASTGVTIPRLKRYYDMLRAA